MSIPSLLRPSKRVHHSGARSRAPRGLRLLLCALLASSGLHAFAQSSGGNFVLTKFAVAGGGGAASGGAFSVATTAGQPAGVHSGGAFQLVGGFHQPKGSGANSARLFCDGFESSSCP